MNGLSHTFCKLVRLGRHNRLGGAARNIPRVAIAALVSLCGAGAYAQTPPPGMVLLNQLRAGGLVLFMRHAHADVGEDAIKDSEYWKECGKQRNLSVTGKLDASRVGLALRGNGIPVSRVLTGNLCRAMDTGKLLQLGAVDVTPSLNDYNTWKAMGNDPEKLPDAYKAIISQAPAPGTNYLLISHSQRGRFAVHAVLELIEMGTIAVFKPTGAGAFELIATVRPSDWVYLGVQELPSK